jgi:site-specific recombinase XerD
VPWQEISLSSQTSAIPNADELAAFRAWLGGMRTRAAVERFLPEQRAERQSSRTIVGSIRRRLIDLARARHRADLVAAISARPRTRLAKAAPLAIETLRASRVPVPQLSDAVELWLPPRIAQPLIAAGLMTLADLIVRRAASGNWWKRVPGIGATGASNVTAFVRKHPNLARLPIAVAQEIAPWESLRPPRELDGSQGMFRAPRATCVLAANNDYDAIRAWLSLQESDATRRAYRKEAERLLLWSIVERNKAISSLLTEDAIAYRAFLRYPTPRDRWVGPKAARSSPAWRPFEGRLSARSTAYALQVVRALYRWLIEQRYLLANPFAGVKVQGAGRTGPLDAQRAFTEHEWSLIRKVAEFTRIEEAMSEAAFARLLFLLDFSYATGLRANETVGARLGNISADERGAKWLEVRGKGARLGRVALPPLAWSALEHYLRHRGISVQMERWDPNAPLVGRIGDEGEDHITASRLWRVMKQFFLRAADVLKTSSPSAAQRARLASPHWMRHTHASHGLARGIDVTVMRDNLRHSSIAVTSTYLHADDSRRATALTKAFGR